MNIKNVLKTAGKTLGSMIVGAIIGLIIFVSCGLYFWLPRQVAELPSGFAAFFGAIALIVVSVIIFSAIGIFFGAIAGLIVFLILRIRKKK